MRGLSTRRPQVSKHQPHSLTWRGLPDEPGTKAKAAFVVGFDGYVAAALWMGFVLGGCSAPPPVSEAEAAAEALVVSGAAIARDFAERQQMPHGAAGDTRFVFVAEPLHGRVIALSRFGGEQVGEVPAPSGGWRLPFALHLTPEGTLVVLDPGGFPAPGALLSPALHEYAFEWRKLRQRLEFVHVRSISLADHPIVFPEDFEISDEGYWIVSEAGIGALWVITPEGEVRPGLFPQSFAPQHAIPALSGCAFPAGVVVDGLPFELAGGFAPGVGSLESRDGQLYFGNTCTGGVWSIPIASLLDSRAPHERAADIVRVIERPHDVTAETLKGLNFGEDGWLYALDPLHFRVIRIRIETGEREVVLEDDVLLNFPVSSTFLPPVLGVSPLLVVSDQEHRLAALNVALDVDAFELPFRITKLYLRRDR